MTPRRTPAQLLVRAFAVVGGAAVLLILGAAAAGAADAPDPGRPDVGARPPITVPQPAPITIAVPLPPVVTPLAPSGTSVSLRTPVVAVGVGDQGVGISIDPKTVVPPLGTPPVPTLPIDPVGDRTPHPDATPTSDGTTTGGAAPAARTRHRDRVPTPTVTALDRPAPVDTPRPLVPIRVAFELAGLAAGIELSARRRGAADPTAVPGIVSVCRMLLGLGPVGRAPAPIAPPGFGLRLARPG